jgi:hypothetical protein
VVRGWLGACVGVCVCACVRGWICVCMSTMHGVCCDDEDREGWLGWVGLVGLMVVCVWMWVCVGVMWLVGWWLVVGLVDGGWCAVTVIAHSSLCAFIVFYITVVGWWDRCFRCRLCPFFFHIYHTHTHTRVCVWLLYCSLFVSVSLFCERETHTRLRMDNMAVRPDRLVGFVHGIKHLQLSLFTSSSSQMMIYVNRDCNGCKCGHVSHIFCCC